MRHVPARTVGYDRRYIHDSRIEFEGPIFAVTLSFRFALDVGLVGSGLWFVDPRLPAYDSHSAQHASQHNNHRKEAALGGALYIVCHLFSPLQQELCERATFVSPPENSNF